MGRAKSKQPARPSATSAPSGQQASGGTGLTRPVCGAAVLTLAVLVACSFSSIATAASDAEECPAAGPLESKGLLASLSEQHNASLFWGTYRPNVYFGMRSRTAPEALVAGIMWGFKGSDKKLVLRHQCEESDDLEKYGWDLHDGVNFGHQQIRDKSANLMLNTSFVKRPGKQGWHARITGSSLRERLKPKKISLFFYASLINDTQAHMPVEQLSPPAENNIELSKHQLEEVTHLVATSTNPELESVSITASSNHDQLYSEPGLILQTLESNISQRLSQRYDIQLTHSIILILGAVLEPWCRSSHLQALSEEAL